MHSKFSHYSYWLQLPRSPPHHGKMCMAETGRRQTEWVAVKSSKEVFGETFNHNYAARRKLGYSHVTERGWFECITTYTYSPASDLKPLRMHVPSFIVFSWNTVRDCSGVCVILYVNVTGVPQFKCYEGLICPFIILINLNATDTPFSRQYIYWSATISFHVR